jgi:hypothetical protein
VDWEWLARQPAVSESGAVRHLAFAKPLLVKVNGRRHEGVIFKPGMADRDDVSLPPARVPAP